jgi:hypothetical protein
MHATDSEFLDRRHGIMQSKGCIRIFQPNCCKKRKSSSERPFAKRRWHNLMLCASDSSIVASRFCPNRGTPAGPIPEYRKCRRFKYVTLLQPKGRRQAWCAG